MYYLKESIFLFFYSIMVSLISLITAIVEALWLRYTLCILCILLMLFTVVFDCVKEGEKAYKTLHKNDTIRRRIIETGDDIFFDARSEYKPIKGFLICLFSCIPTLLCLLAHLIIILSGGATNVLGDIAATICYVFFSPLYLIYDSSLSSFAYFIPLSGVLLTIVLGGVAYMLGAKKISLQYDMIEEKRKAICGE